MANFKFIGSAIAFIVFLADLLLMILTFSIPILPELGLNFPIVKEVILFISETFEIISSAQDRINAAIILDGIVLILTGIVAYSSNE